MKRTLYILAAAAVLSAVLGCNTPTAIYDRNREVILRSQSRLVEGDQALTRGDVGRAADRYAKASGDLAAAITNLETAERDIDSQLRELDQAGAPQTGGVGGTRFYTDTLRAYREALALAIVLKALALERQGEAAYRSAAQAVLDGDAAYASRQFATAAREFSDADRDFGRAIASFTDTLDFLKWKGPAASRLTRSAPPQTWGVLEPLRQNVTHRLVQAGAYRSSASQRALQAAHVVSLYRQEDVGNIPEVDIVPLVPLPDVVRSGVTPPPVPSATLAK